jgi:20S proteasome alpha/beta subunit
MSLIISLRVPDGLVIAGDSYRTTMRTLQFQGEIEAVCSECKQKTKIRDVVLPSIPFPSASFSNAQKIFPLTKKIGAGVYGAGIVNGKSLYYLVRQLREKLKHEKINETASVAEFVAQGIHKDLLKEAGQADAIPSDLVIVGMLVVGYDKDGSPCTFEAKIGRECAVELNSRDPGITIGGDKGLAISVMNSLIESTGIHFESYSLQDALDLAELLIDTTARAQRFGASLPTVGGNVDIALVTEYSGFKWVKSKKMTNILEDENGTPD